MIYFDSAATSMLKPDVVAKAVANAMTTMGNAGRYIAIIKVDNI